LMRFTTRPVTGRVRHLQLRSTAQQLQRCDAAAHLLPGRGRNRAPRREAGGACKRNHHRSQPGRPRPCGGPAVPRPSGRWRANLRWTPRPLASPPASGAFLLVGGPHLHSGLRIGGFSTREPPSLAPKRTRPPFPASASGRTPELLASKRTRRSVPSGAPKPGQRLLPPASAAQRPWTGRHSQEPGASRAVVPSTISRGSPAAGRGHRTSGLVVGGARARAVRRRSRPGTVRVGIRTRQLGQRGIVAPAGGPGPAFRPKGPSPRGGLLVEQKWQ